jgi:hypothetical protein
MSDTNHHVLTGKVDITSNLLVGSSHLFVDTNNNRVGLVTTDPDAGLHVNSNAYVNTDLRVGSGIVINDSANPGRITATEFEGDGSRLSNVPSGPPGAAATIDAGTTTTGAAGSSASVTNSGTTSAAVFDFTIPRGDQGIQGIQGIQGVQGNQGVQGPSGTITIGTVTTVTNSSGASVTNSGTSENAVFNFNIPEGPTGQPGTNGTNGTDGADGTNYFTLSGSNIYRSTGNVGIGTSSPMTKLDIQCNAAQPSIVLSDTSNSRYQTGIGSVHVSNQGQRMDFYTGDSGANGTLLTSAHSRMSILAGGNVGVGTTAPAAIFEVVGGYTTSPIKKTAPSAPTNEYNFVLNGPRPGTTTHGATHFINGSTRNDDGGNNTYTIRNDSGQLRLGHSSYTTLFQGNHLRMAEGDNSFFHFGPNGTWGGELFVGATSDRTSITSASKAQVISTDGNLHLDSGAGKNLYLNHYGGALGAVYRKGPQYWNSRPMVMVGKNNGRVYYNNYVIFNAVGYNDGNMYNSSNGRFTAIWTGYYLFTTTLLGGHQELNCNTRWYKNGADVGWGAAHFNMGSGFNFSYNNSRNGLSSQMIYYMNQFDYMQLRIVGGSMYGSSQLHSTTTCVYLGGRY